MKYTGSKDIKNFVNEWVFSNVSNLKSKKILDFPTGNGATAKDLQSVGADVIAMDLFPSFFRVEGISCVKADLEQTIPMESSLVDYAICQEGIEHVADQLKVFKEFSRVLKPGGRFLVTTPNYSNLRSRISYLFCESELFGRIMAPNVVDSVWFSDGSCEDFYFGHINSVGVQKLKIFGELANFRLTKVHGTRVNYTSLLLFPFLFPFVLLFSSLAYLKFKKKRNPNQISAVKETFSLMINPSVLLMGHLMLEFKKDPAIKREIMSLHAATHTMSGMVT